MTKTIMTILPLGLSGLAYAHPGSEHAATHAVEHMLLALALVPAVALGLPLLRRLFSAR